MVRRAERRRQQYRLHPVWPWKIPPPACRRFFQYLFRHMLHPIGDAEGAEFGEMAVIERQNKMRAVRQRLNGMAVAFGKYHTSPGPKSATSHLPSGSRMVMRAWPSSINAHSAAMACQCSSRTPPGSSVMSTPATPSEIGNCSTVASRAQPLGRLRFLLSVNLYL